MVCPVIGLDVLVPLLPVHGPSPLVLRTVQLTVLAVAQVRVVVWPLWRSEGEAVNVPDGGGMRQILEPPMHWDGETQVLVEVVMLQAVSVWVSRMVWRSMQV